LGTPEIGPRQLANTPFQFFEATASSGSGNLSQFVRLLKFSMRQSLQAKGYSATAVNIVKSVLILENLEEKYSVL